MENNYAAFLSAALNAWMVRFQMCLNENGQANLSLLSEFLIGCEKNWEVMRHLKVSLCSKKGRLNVANYAISFLAYLTFSCFIRSERSTVHFLLFKKQLEQRGMMKTAEIDHCRILNY